MVGFVRIPPFILPLIMVKTKKRCTVIGTPKQNI